MIQYLLNKMYEDKKSTIGNVVITTCIASVLAVCVQIAMRLMQMLKDDWYKNSIEIASNGDLFIREKMGVIITFIFVIITVIYVFCGAIYILKMRLDIVKERSRLGVFKVLGYIDMQLAVCIFLSKIPEIITASVFAGGVAIGIWKVLCSQKIFIEFMTLLDNNMNFDVQVICINVIVLMILAFLTTYICVRRNVCMMDMKGDQE